MGLGYLRYRLQDYAFIQIFWVVLFFPRSSRCAVDRLSPQPPSERGVTEATRISGTWGKRAGAACSTEPMALSTSRRLHNSVLGLYQKPSRNALLGRYCRGT